VVDSRASSTAPFFARLVNAVSLRRLMFAPLPTKPLASKSVLSPDEVRALEEIVVECDSQVPGRSRNVHEIIEIALQRLRRDLDSGFEDEIIEDLQREIDYRLWRARHC
jgi:hypothetical protein